MVGLAFVISGVLFLTLGLDEAWQGFRGNLRSRIGAWAGLCAMVTMGALAGAVVGILPVSLLSDVIHPKISSVTEEIPHTRVVYNIRDFGVDDVAYPIERRYTFLARRPDGRYEGQLLHMASDVSVVYDAQSAEEQRLEESWVRRVVREEYRIDRSWKGWLVWPLVPDSSQTIREEDSPATFTIHLLASRP